jgi:hypothetical protein
MYGDAGVERLTTVDGSRNVRLMPRTLSSRGRCDAGGGVVRIQGMEPASSLLQSTRSRPVGQHELGFD